jgi:hypothetical protein
VSDPPTHSLSTHRPPRARVSVFTMPVTKRQKLHGSMVVMRRGLGNKPLVEELSDGCVAVNTSESDDD